MAESSRWPEAAAHEHENQRRQRGDERQGDGVRENTLELQEGKLVEGGRTVLVIVARIGGHAADVQLECMVMTVKRLVIRKGMKMHAEPLHDQEHQHDTPDQRAMA